MRPSSVTTVDVQNPEHAALRCMGIAAKQAAETFTMKEWASVLATKAPPRDYVGQLHALYDGILHRWRYVMETGEWVPGSGYGLLRHVLGLKYSAPKQDARRVSVASIRNARKGWGDCDDVSALVAAGVLSLGMVPFFRVSRGPKGAHVSVLAQTPSGRLVSVDPVGHPRHRFGWALKAPIIRIYDLNARRVR